jgi:N-acetyl-gamma-glutamyl-phosphate reductase
MLRVGIVGCTGYAGIELVKILLNHKEFSLEYLSSSSIDGEYFSNLFGFMQSITDLKVSKTNVLDIINKCDIIFLATPHKESMKYVKELYSKVKIIDLSADYRLSQKTYEENYTKHIDSKNIINSSYGLPELNREKIKNSSLVANPGCYPTASLLGLMPFIKYIKDDSYIFIDAKSGLSGAGKKLSNVAHFANMNENSMPYNVYSHRHFPEILEHIKKSYNKNLNIKFVPTLLPVTRGMQTNIYISNFKEKNSKEILDNFYQNEQFVRIKDKPTELKAVQGTNFCDIFVTQDKDSLFINTSIDNLLRGASSQAVVNANIMSGFKEDLSIPKIAYVP